MPTKKPSTAVTQGAVQPSLLAGSPPPPAPTAASNEDTAAQAELTQVTNDDDDDDEQADAAAAEQGEEATTPAAPEVETAMTSTQPPLPDEPAPPATGVHKGRDPNWTAVWDPTAQAYYFHHTLTGVTQWTNPFEAPVDSTPTTQPTAGPSTTTATTTADAQDDDPNSHINYRGIDPDLAFLDPNLARQQTRGGAAPVFQARFNSKTGRFQGDPSMVPDRISDYSRSSRQQQAFYDTNAWTESLQGRGLYQGQQDEVEEQGGRKRKPSSKEVQAFKDKKEQKKRAKLMTFLKS
ncbi:BZ3500_MvSof-1268-A1-R1_Chr10-1g02661 [Microbotryum saponariae]|uniref:BZ3500_MvSof-1268-A1-R1_Chr10-1g02661 protein n=1 Tax=Microbotryum saponariae TaxID=289078 RepID=A0A2X0LQI5_9BASI|nr:BZ3500_MvSof-1268-A1-R1_Chr10-1g02661 [Microbotryum saponariae]SDA06150.1 BZ3501_MvSof-1269-A2-R1_Chr10-1g02262 [Microbotryum saponariae]